MLGTIRNFFEARKAKAQIILCIQTLYSEDFDMGSLLKRTARTASGIDMVRALVAVQTAAKISEPLTDANVAKAVDQANRAAKHINDSEEFAELLKAHKDLAEVLWHERRRLILEGKLAHQKNEYSLEGTIYWIQHTSKGPVAKEKRQEFARLTKELQETEHALEAHTAAREAEARQREQADERSLNEIKEEHERLKRQLELLEDPATIYAFGQMALDGDGVEQDAAAAANWFRMAAEQGHELAQHNLALMYDNGEGVPQDCAEAARFYRMAADQGNAGSQNNLGVLYQTGSGVKENFAEAAKWFRKAADQGAANAQGNLARLYSDGKGVSKNDAEAFRLYRLAASSGDPDLQYYVSLLYAVGKGVAADADQAEIWCRKAAAGGNVEASAAYFINDDKTSGPHAWEDVREMWHTAEVSRDALCRAAIWPDWRSLSEVMFEASVEEMKRENENEP